MPTSPDCFRAFVVVALSLAFFICVAACRGPRLATPGQVFSDERTSLKGGRVSRRDAALFDRYYDAALAGDREAQTLVALMFQMGQGVPRNEAESAHWFREAAEADECAAQYHLGLLYLQGRGVRTDIEHASRWLRRAADHRIEIQQASFRTLYRSVMGLGGADPRPPPLAEIVNESIASAERDQRAAEALYGRGSAYLEGVDVPIDAAHAVRFFRMAANEGHPPAQYALGMAYRSGHGTRPDPVRAHMWLNIAASSGSAAARQDLAALESALSTDEILRAEFLAAEWKARRAP